MYSVSASLSSSKGMILIWHAYVNYLWPTSMEYVKQLIVRLVCGVIKNREVETEPTNFVYHWRIDEGRWNDTEIKAI